MSKFKEDIRQIHGQQVLRWTLKGTGKDEPYNIPNTTLVDAGQYDSNGLQKSTGFHVLLLLQVKTEY